MAEGARLESVYTATYRGSNPPHRHIRDESLYASTGSFLLYSPQGDENPRPGFDNWQRQLDRPQACERAAPQGRAKRVNPPHRHIRDESLYASTGSFFYILRRGMRTPDRGSTTGNASWTDRKPASGLPRRGERSESIPPHRHIRDESLYASTGSFLLYSPQGDENPRPGFDNWQRQLDRPQACERAAPQGRAKRVNPPSPPYFKKSSYASTGFFSHVAPQTSPGSAAMPLPGYQTLPAR